MNSAVPSPEYAHRLLDLLPQIVWTAGPDGSVDYFNQRWFDYTGMTLDQTRDWGWLPVIHPDDLPNCIAFEAEVGVFSQTLTLQWLSDVNEGWGIYVNAHNKAQYLGISKCGKRDLLIAKFKMDNNQDEWHGYPADHLINNHDVPPESIAHKWMLDGQVEPPTIRKLLRGQKCHL